MKFYNTSFLDFNHYFCSFVLYIRGPLVFQFFTVTCLPLLNKVDYDDDDDYYYYYYLHKSDAYHRRTSSVHSGTNNLEGHLYIIRIRSRMVP